jgi:hypothetical protein
MRERRAAADMATCKSFGFEVGQPQYNQCIVTEQRYRKTQNDIAWNRIQQQRQATSTPEASTSTGINTYYRINPDVPVRQINPLVPVGLINPFGN